MPTLLIAEWRQEVSSFNPVPSRYADFDVLAGDALIECHRRMRDEVGGAGTHPTGSVWVIRLGQSR